MVFMVLSIRRSLWPAAEALADQTAGLETDRRLFLTRHRTDRNIAVPFMVSGICRRSTA